MKRILSIFICIVATLDLRAQNFVSETPLSAGSFPLTDFALCVDSNDFAVVRKSAELLQHDLEMVTGIKPVILHQLTGQYKNIIAIGSISRSIFIQQLVKEKNIDTSSIAGKWEAYQLQVIQMRPGYPTGQNIIAIAGSDARGTAFGVFEFSKQAGISPWYWWADVPVTRKTLFINSKPVVADSPKVKYRGIFINDEAPALSGWSKEKFGGFNHLFYEKVFELMLRLKANYIWPAMWGNAFYDDDSLNIKSAEQYGIVIGTSHHEPLTRAHDEWRRYGKGKWNYDSNEVNLKKFWTSGLQRATSEKIVTVGMRGDGDEPMTRETATALLERIVKDQRAIIENVTGKPAAATPQLWALYKEVQDYYDKGMRVPDDITLLLCDDNWGNIRKLPGLTEKPRKGGYGIYYHFDYVGGPRNYKWLNTNPIPRVWEQMHLAWEYKAREIWIVNVGDIKPMEFPISFFLDYAWNPERIGANDLQKYTEQWSASQFGPKYKKEIAELISSYSKFNSRRKPELLNENTYSMETFEAEKVTNEFNLLLTKATRINNQLSPEYRDAFFQLVLHPIKACANLQEMYFNVAQNKIAYKKGIAETNNFADKVAELYKRDSLITKEYHTLNNGKWNQMMSQAHIGYTNWQQPPAQKMPSVQYIPKDSIRDPEPEYDTTGLSAKSIVPQKPLSNRFYQLNGYVSIDASHFTKAINTNGITWKVLPDHGRTGSAITPFPVTAPEQKLTATAAHVEYEFYTYQAGPAKLFCYFSPTLNFHNTSAGLRYAVSVDNETPHVISINAEDKATGSGIWNKWVGENIIIKMTGHHLIKEGKHTIKYWMIDPAVVLQKLVLDMGGLQPSYLGPEETKK